MQGIITNGLKVDYDVAIPAWIRISYTPLFEKVPFGEFRGASSKGICVNYMGNDEDVREALMMADAYGFDYVQVRPALKLDGLTTKISPPRMMHSKLTITDYKFNEASKKHGYTKCEGHHFVPFVWQDGDVDVCAYHRGNPEYNMGNIYENTFDEMRKDYAVVMDDCQVCCRNHEINKTVHQARQLEDLTFP